MIFFGHLGITTAIVKTYEKLFYKEKHLINNPTIDYRFVLIGSILPDLIDKPIGVFLFRNTFHNSRIFAHTLVFSVALIFIGTYLIYKRRKNNVLLLGICSSIHLVLDSMWLYPGILFWPYFAVKFPVRAEGNWLNSDIIRLVSDPSYYLAEIIGFIIIAYYFIKSMQNKQLKDFISYGKL